jgi:toxin ParE1/3/4
LTVPSFRLTAAAENDLLSIWDYIAQDNPDAATRQLIKIDETAALLGDNPQLGPARPDIAPEMRYFPTGSYLILYRIVPEGVEIVRVLHGARNIPALFPPDDL